MGRGATPTAGPFSAAVIEYVRHIVTVEGGDQSGRWLAERLPRAATYYRDRLAGEKLYDTNDIADIARLFGMTPLALVRAAIAHEARTRPDNVRELRPRLDERAHAAKKNTRDLDEEDHIP